MSLLPVAQAQARLFALGHPLPVEDVAVSQAAGRYLGRDLLARRDQPWAALSAMDGYALRAEEQPGPWRVVATSSAGDGPPAPLQPNEAARIFTGAPVPSGADAILIQEDALIVDGMLKAGADAHIAPGRFVRAAATEFAEGSTLLAAGARLDAPQIALAILGGHASLPVRRRPRIALLSTGNELVPPGSPTNGGRLPSSNAAMLAAMLANQPCDVVDLGIVPDDLHSTIAALKQAIDADIVVTTGGASVGDHDLVKPAVEMAGGVLDFWKVRLRPGKPLIAGRLGDGVFLGLPGNPVSAFVTATLFLLPLVRHLAGAADPLPVTRKAVLAAPLEAIGDRDAYLRARHVDDAIVPVASQDSSASFSLAMADCLITRPAHSQALNPGDPVTILPFA